MRGSVVIALGLALVGFGLFAGLVYADLTTTITRAEYDQYQANCDELANQSRPSDPGIGMEQVELNETAVRQCRNTTFEQYRTGRIQSVYQAPLSARQWLLFGGPALVMGAGGVALLRQELSPGE